MGEGGLLLGCAHGGRRIGVGERGREAVVGAVAVDADGPVAGAEEVVRLTDPYVLAS